MSCGTLRARSSDSVTAQQAADLGVGKGALQMLVQRSTLTRVAHGVYRFPQYPVGQYDPYMLAVLWTRAPEACLSHETALDAYGISDVNPNRIHVTVAKHRRLRRASGDDYVIHREDLTPAQIGWCRDPHRHAGDSCWSVHRIGTPTYLLSTGHRPGACPGLSDVRRT